jgi:hypothetical protein
MSKKNADIINTAIQNMIQEGCIVIMFNRCIILLQHTAIKYKHEK